MQKFARKRLRAKEVSAIYGVSQSTVWGYTRKGLLKPIRVTPGTTLFDVDEVEKLFSNSKTDTTNEVA